MCIICLVHMLDLESSSDQSDVKRGQKIGLLASILLVTKLVGAHDHGLTPSSEAQFDVLYILAYSRVLQQHPIWSSG
jgi:hypothetical protein